VNGDYHKLPTCLFEIKLKDLTTIIAVVLTAAVECLKLAVKVKVSC